MLQVCSALPSSLCLCRRPRSRLALVVVGVDRSGVRADQLPLPLLLVLLLGFARGGRDHGLIATPPDSTFKNKKTRILKNTDIFVLAFLRTLPAAASFRALGKRDMRRCRLLRDGGGGETRSAPLQSAPFRPWILPCPSLRRQGD